LRAFAIARCVKLANELSLLKKTINVYNLHPQLRRGIVARIIFGLFLPQKRSRFKVSDYD
jgi:hypothetical protein